MKKTDKNIKVAVLTGGDSSERTVALQSTKGIIGPLRDNYDVKVFDFPKGIDTFLKEYKNYHVAIPVFHGPGGEDGQIQGLLNVLGLPFIFSDVEAHALGMNKAFSKEIVSAAGLLAPKHKVLSTGENFSYQKPIVINQWPAEVQLVSTSLKIKQAQIILSNRHYSMINRC